MKINNKTRFSKLFFSLFFTVITLHNFVYSADTIPTQIPDLDEQVDITLSPQYPEPGESVTITLDAYGIDLDNSKIKWTSNERVLLEGAGQKVLQTTSGSQGQITVIKVLINAPNSKPVEKTITLNPQSVDILWEAKTYTPPFYKGKAMYTPQESIKFIAMPNQIAADKAIYKWSQDYEVLGSKSGFAKNTLSYTGDILANQVDISVEASDGGSNVARKTLSIAPVNPEVYLYEDSPLYGKLFNREISTLFDLGTRQEGSISVYPFFYGINDRNDSTIEYRWAINGRQIEVPTFQNDMTFRNTENVAGKSSISISVTNTENYFGDIQKSTLVNFSKSGAAFSF